jgi:uncharacterized protein YacL
MNELAQGLILGLVVYLLIDIRKSLNKSPQKSKNSSVVIDTSALIDGRITEVARAGFLTGNIIIAKKVLDELQLLADGRDAHKRERARYGLDVVDELKNQKDTNVIIDDIKINSDLSTDEFILQLALKRKARLCTTDFNLNKVASLEGIKVLNVNELAQSLRPKVLPGEVVEVKIIQDGESKNQGVGYLDDGTMVVVDNAIRMRHKTITATVDRMIQTKAGKMCFATFKQKKS